MKAGDTSAAHDARVFDGSFLNVQPEDYFKDDEYLLGDSAYTVINRMVCPYKTPYPSPVHDVLNSTMSSQRIAIEHGFGILKARFPSITNISSQIQGKESHQAVVDWFLGACILQNFLPDANDREWDNTEDPAYATRHQLIVEQAQEAHANRLAALEERGGRQCRGARHIENVRDRMVRLF